LSTVDTGEEAGGPMNKAELIEALAVHFDGNKAEAGRMLNIVLETVMQETVRNGKVGITGFGVFETVRRDARMVRNPRTGERKRADATQVVRFRPGADLRAYAARERELPAAPTKWPAGKKRPGRKKAAG
jgi:DNA-binding protein HU-beta